MTSTIATGSISGVQARRKTIGGHVQVKLLDDVRIAERIVQVRGFFFSLGSFLGFLSLLELALCLSKTYEPFQVIVKTAKVIQVSRMHGKRPPEISSPWYRILDVKNSVHQSFALLEDVLYILQPTGAVGEYAARQCH